MLALAFPGQGSQRVGMGKAFYDRYPVARETFEEANEILGADLAALCFEGPEAELRLTAHAQPAILTTSIAVWRALCSQVGTTEYMEWGEIIPDVVAGHSLGEYSALVCAGALSFPDGLRLVRERGQAMQEAVPDGQGAMAAILGASREQVEDLCKVASAGEILQAANLNGASEIVISGTQSAVERAVELATSYDATAKRLQVSAPFHCPLMAPAARRLEQVLADVEVRSPQVPIIANVDAEPHREASHLKQLLIEQVTAPVRWEDGVRKMAEMGVGEIFELGPGGTLTKLIRRIAPEIRVLSVEGPEQLDEIRSRLPDDLERFTRKWRDEGWQRRDDGVRINADKSRLFLPVSHAEWVWDDPNAHSF